MRCETRVNKNLIAERGCNKHYLVAENECTNRTNRSFIMTERRIEQIENYRQVNSVIRGNVTKKIEPMSDIFDISGFGKLFFSFTSLFCYKLFQPSLSSGQHNGLECEITQIQIPNRILAIMREVFCALLSSARQRTEQCLKFSSISFQIKTHQ